MKFLNLIIIMVILAIITSIVTIFFAKQSYIYGKQEIPMDIEVVDYIGLNVDKDALHFGGGHPNDIGRRNMIVRNDYAQTVLIDIKTKGEISGWTKINDSHFLLESGGKRNIEFLVKIPGDAQYGNYTGTALIYYVKP